MIIFIVPKNSGLEICSKYTFKYSSDKTKIVKVRGEDVPLFVEKISKQGKNVIGITGEDLFFEYLFDNPSFNISENILWEDNSFVFGKPALCLLGPKEKPSSLEKLTIIVNKKYKNLSARFIKKYFKDKSYQVIYASGATEEMFLEGAADYVVDIVCSGKSAKEAGLIVYETIFLSNLVAITYSENNFSLSDLYDVIVSRVKDNKDNSYTKKLFSNSNELKRKIIEEAGEVTNFDSRENLIWECSDLIYFLFVLMVKEGITLPDIEKENERRNKETLLNNRKLESIEGGK